MPYFEVQLTKKLQRLYDLEPDMVIGRAPQCQIQFLSRAVSRRHARVEFDNNECIVSDLGTKNGIKLNGQKIEGAAVVSDGDKVVVGDITMVFRGVDRVPGEGEIIDLSDRPAGPAEVKAALGKRVTFRIRADENAISQFQSTVGRTRIDKLEFDDDGRFKLQIALKEVLENARVHGSASDPNKKILVSFTEDDDEFVMTVKDEGAGYNVQKVLGEAEEVDAMEAIRNRAGVGPNAGLRILLNCVDRIQFEGSGSTIHMGRFKEAGQLFVISDDEMDAVEEPSDENVIDPFEAAGGLPGIEESDPESDPIQFGDLFTGPGPLE